MSVCDSTRTVSAYGATVLERVLLAIIQAHTTPKTAGQEAARLQAAMDALMGSASPDEKRMEEALQFMTRQRQRAICDVEMAAFAMHDDAAPTAIPTLTELAEMAAREILLCHEEEIPVTSRVLCKRYRQRMTCLTVEVDLIGKALEGEAVARICEDLSEWCILREPGKNMARFPRILGEK